MAAADLGARMGTRETSVLSLESNERTGRVRLDTLQRAANALECDLVYALIPRRPLEVIIDERARARAGVLLAEVDHSMMLEDQRVSAAAAREQLSEQARALIERPGLWRDD